MCILFMHVDPSPKHGNYRLIVATNRDLYYRRPAKPARRDDETFIIGGKDMEPGREGGMWFGFASKKLLNGERKHCVATLLNITGEKAEHAEGRGSIVKDYLKTGDDFPKYAENLDQRTFSGFNFIAAELCKDGAHTFHYGNTPKILSVYSGRQTLGFGNSPSYSPFTKVTNGRRKFEHILSNGLRGTKLVDELINLLKDTACNLPDAELQKRAPLSYEMLSSVFVKIEQGGYGTRAHSIILIDHDWNLEFIEHSLEQPIDIQNPKWLVNEFRAQL